MVPPDDSEALAEAISEVMSDSRLRDGLVVGGLSRAAEFTWERTARGTLEVLRRTVTEARRT